MANIGSFGAAIGGGSPIAQAMARRGIDASVLAQQSPASPGYQQMPSPTTQTNNAMPNVNWGNQPQPQAAAPQAPMAPQPNMQPQQPSMLPTTPPPAPQSSYPVMGAQPAATQPQMNPEIDLILNALNDRLKHHSAVEKAQAQLGSY